MRVSIIIPSIYPHDLERCIASIERGTRCEHEVIVVSPHEPPSPAVWIKEEEPRGAAYAQSVAMEHVKGEFVIAFADDFEFFDGWDKWLIWEFEEREAKHNQPLLMGLRYDQADWVGTCFGLYYPNFPMMRSSMVRKFGWFDGEYQHGFSDCDIGMRIWNIGGFCAFSSRPAIFLSKNEAGKVVDVVRKIKLYEDDDYARFVNRWGQRYGDGWDTTNLQNFNVNISVSAQSHLVSDGCTILKNREPHAILAR